MLSLRTWKCIKEKKHNLEWELVVTFKTERACCLGAFIFLEIVFTTWSFFIVGTREGWVGRETVVGNCLASGITSLFLEKGNPLYLWITLFHKSTHFQSILKWRLIVKNMSHKDYHAPNGRLADLLCTMYDSQCLHHAK